MQTWFIYRGFRIDDRRRTLGCWKVRHKDGASYVMLDFTSKNAAKRFVRENA